MITSLLRTARPRRRLGWLWVVLTIGTVLNGLRLRARLRSLPTVPPAPWRGLEPAVDDEHAGVDPNHVFLTAPGVVLDDETRRAASAYANAQDLDVVDLVPGDLDIERTYEVVRLIDPATYRTNPLTIGRGPQQATLVHREVLARAGISAEGALDPVAYLHVTSELKRFAARTTDLAVSPSLSAVPEKLSRRRAHLSALYSKAMPAFVATPVVQYATLAAGVVVAPFWGTAALAAYAVQPYLAYAGAPVRPSDLTPARVADRPARGLVRALRTARGSWRPPASSTAVGASSAIAESPETDAEKAAAYDELLADGLDRFFEPRRDTCPLCDSGALAERIAVGDLLQFKPGEFHLDECHDCGHVFQNPRLSLEGLDFYYRDFYDGMGGEQLEFVFSSDDTSYRGRAEIVARHAPTTPKRWLDVGGGHGHFCLVAAGVLPDTTFDGLDLGDGIVDAERRRWIDRSFVGLFPDLAPDLTGAYDVVSMHHYLEHTRDPAAELDAADTVLESGGHLLIEVPDPECRYGRALGWMWGPWFQPQHQHFVSVANLTALLGQRGFSVVEVERGPAHQPVDLAFALMLFTNRIAGPPAKPWTGPTSPLARFRRAVCFTTLAPVMVGALFLDRAIAPLVSRRGYSNTYRLLARKD